MSEPITDGGPAFPALSRFYDGGSGMSLRDYFAAKAFQACVIFEQHFPSNMLTREANMQRFAESCYEFADAMLAAREAQP